MFNKKTKKKYKRFAKGGTVCDKTPRIREHYTSMKSVLKELSGGKRRHSTYRRKRRQRGGVASIEGPFSVVDAFNKLDNKGCRWVAVKGSSFGAPNSNATKALELMKAQRTTNAQKCADGIDTQDGGRNRKKTTKKQKTIKKTTKKQKTIKQKRTRTANKLKRKRKRKKLGGNSNNKWTSSIPCYS